MLDLKEATATQHDTNDKPDSQYVDGMCSFSSFPGSRPPVSEQEGRQRIETTASNGTYSHQPHQQQQNQEPYLGVGDIRSYVQPPPHEAAVSGSYSQGSPSGY
jgi:hypothetical protein